jgi:Ca2+-binding EF-hand superfamily protein
MRKQPITSRRKFKMKQRLFIALLSTFIVLTAAMSLPAQENVGHKYQDRYTKDLFNEADTNNDGYINWDEAKAVSAQVERDLFGRKRFNTADLNNDGKLSIIEVRKYKKAEISRKGAAVDKTKKKKGKGSTETEADVLEASSDEESAETGNKQSKQMKKKEQIKAQESSEEKAEEEEGSTGKN